MNLVQMIPLQPLLDCAVKLGPAEVAAGAQLMAEKFMAERNINVNHVPPRFGIAAHRRVVVRAAEILGMKVGAVGGESEPNAADILDPGELTRGPNRPSVDVPVNDSSLIGSLIVGTAGSTGGDVVFVGVAVHPHEGWGQA